MVRKGGLGGSAAAVSGVQPMLRRPQDGTQIERVFSRKKAQNAQKGNPFLSFSRPALGSAKADAPLRGNPQSLRAGGRSGPEAAIASPPAFVRLP